jgi:hypothetical protein
MDLKKLYGTAGIAAGVNTTPSGGPPPRLETFWLHFSDGRKISYPYRYVGPIEIDADEERIVILCTCDAYRSIIISGERLSVLVRGLDAGSIDVIRETPRPDFIPPGGMVVFKIEVVKSKFD